MVCHSTFVQERTRLRVGTEQKIHMMPKFFIAPTRVIEKGDPGIPVAFLDGCHKNVPSLC
jgi:hypothetical protein